jgi:hypothetical protein
MFSGGGVAWAEAALKRGEFAVSPAPPGTWPDLTGLSCRFQEIKATHGRMVIDCTADLAEALDRRLAAASNIAYYGLHRQEAAIMTCFTPSAVRVDHVHFIDGAQGGYTASATALKAAATLKKVRSKIAARSEG